MRDPLTGQTITSEALLNRSVAHIESCLVYQTTKRFWHVLTEQEQKRALQHKTRDLINESPAAVQPQLRSRFRID